MFKFLEQRKAWAPNVLGIFFGIALLIGGLDKIFSLPMATQMFSGLFGAGMSWLVYVAIIIELVGGLALILNWHRREAALILAVFFIVAFVATFKLGPAPHIFATLREIVIMNTGGGNTAVNFAYFTGMISLAFSGCKQCKKR